MFLAAQTRKGIIHVVTYKSIERNYRTFCNKMIMKSELINTIGIDESFNGLCPLCKYYFDEMMDTYRDLDPRVVRNRKTHQAYDLVWFHRYNARGPYVKYYGVMHRDWWRLLKYQALPKKNIRISKFRKKYYG